MARQAVPVAGPVAPAPWHKPHNNTEEGRDCQQRGEDLFRLSYGVDAEPQSAVPSAADLSADPAFDPGPELSVPVRRALEVEPSGDAGQPAADIPTVLTKLKVRASLSACARTVVRGVLIILKTVQLRPQQRRCSEDSCFSA